LVEVGGQILDPGAAAMSRSIGVVILAGLATRIQGLFLFAVAALGLRTQAFPRWLVWLSYAIGLVLIIDITLTQPSIYIFPTWVALVSIALLVSPARLGQGRQAESQ
jgi:hypothetical protein